MVARAGGGGAGGDLTAPSGHRTVPHTADLRIEAWGPTRERCLVEAVRCLVASFADATGVHPLRTDRLDLPSGPDADVLVALLDEVVYRLDAEGELVLDTEITQTSDGGFTAWLTVGDAGQAVPVGAVPKAVSLHDLRFGADPRTGVWSCAVTIDV